MVFLVCLTAILLAAAVLLSDRLGLCEDQLGYLGAIVLFFITAAVCAVFGKDRRRKQIVMSGLLYGLAGSVLLLMTGFLCNADRMAALGVLRVSLACLGGCLTGVWFGSLKNRDKKNRSLRRFGI